MNNDFYGPILQGLEFISPPKNLLLPGDEFTIKYSASDPSGIREAWIDYYYINPITGLAKPVEIVDDNLDGLITFKINDEYWADGKYRLMFVTLVDSGGYRVTYTNAGIINGATQGAAVHSIDFSNYDVNVSNPKADVYGPVLNDFTITGDFGHPFKIGDKISIRYNATDASGLDFVSFSWWWTDPITGVQRSKEFKDADFDGLIEITIGETPDMYGSKEWYTGTYKLFYVQLIDRAFKQVNERNIVGYNFGGIINGASIERSHNFDYSVYDINITSGETDNLGPVINAVIPLDSFSDAKVIGDKVKIKYDAYDPSGLSSAWLTFSWTNSITGNVVYKDVYDENLDGIFEINIDKSWSEGAWKLRFFNIVDDNLTWSDHNRVCYLFDGTINGPSLLKSHQLDYSIFDFNVIKDTQPPTLEISSSLVKLGRDQISKIIFHFSENPGELFLQDEGCIGLSVVGGSLSSFSHDALNRYCIFTPAPNYIGAATIKVDKSTFSDFSGNINLNDSYLDIKVDTVDSFVVNNIENPYHFNGNKKIEGVVVYSQDLMGVGGILSPHRYKITPISSSVVSKENSSINLTDVLDALKIYLGKPIANQKTSSFSCVAADFNADGEVNLNDVLLLLKYYLGKNTGAVLPQWSFVSSKDVFISEGVKNIALNNNEIVDRHNTKINDIFSDDANATDVSLIGILRGDVDGSWTG